VCVYVCVCVCQIRFKQLVIVRLHRGCRQVPAWKPDLCCELITNKQGLVRKHCLSYRGVLSQDALYVRSRVQLVVEAGGHGHLAVHIPVLDDDEVVPAWDASRIEVLPCSETCARCSSSLPSALVCLVSLSCLCPRDKDSPLKEGPPHLQEPCKKKRERECSQGLQVASCQVVAVLCSMLNGVLYNCLPPLPGCVLGARAWSQFATSYAS